MLQNAYFLAKIGADTAENEHHLAENLPKFGNYPTVPSIVAPPGARRRGPAAAGGARRLAALRGLRRGRRRSLA